MRDGRLVANATDGVVWDYPFVEESKNDEVLPPVETLEGDVFLCGGHRLVKLRKASGQVIDRWYLPGECTSLTQDAGVATVQCDVGDGPDRAPFTWRSNAPNARSAAMLPGGPSPFYQTREQALRELAAAPETQQTHIEGLRMTEREFVRAVRSDQDPTNPWWMSTGDMSSDQRALGMNIEHTVRDMIEHAHDEKALDLMLMSFEVEKLEQNLGEAAFVRGAQTLIAADYAPELATSLISAMRFLPKPGTNLSFDSDYDRLATYGRWLGYVAPRIEGASDFYAALANAAAHKGLPASVAENWRRRSEHAEPFRSFGGSTPESRFAGHLVDGAIASTWAIVIVLIAKTLRRRTQKVESSSKLARFNPFAKWSLGERVGFIVASLMTMAMLWAAAWGVAEIGAYASAPIELGAGNLGHPAAVRYTERFRGSSGGDRIHAAAQWSASLDPGRSRPSRGLSSVVENLEHGVSDDDWPDAWRNAVSRSTHGMLYNPIVAMISVVQMSDVLSTNEVRYSASTLVPVLLLMFFFVLSLLPPLTLGPRPEPNTRLALVLDLMFPGTSARYGALGFLFACLVGTWLLGAWMIAVTGGKAATILDAIAAFDMKSVFGVQSLPQHNPDPILPFYGLGWLLLVVHVTYVAWVTRRDKLVL